jgi:hypothetical protein
MSSKDSISKSLSQWRKTINVLSPPSWRELLGPDHSLDVIISSPVLRSSAPLLKAFEYFGLEPKKSLHQALLLRLLAEVCFHPRLRHRPTGTEIWDDVRYCDLAHCFETVSQQDEGMSDARAAKLIKQYCPGFKHISCGTIRQRLPEARRRIKKVRQKKKKPKIGLLRFG